jgi:hypothetical protein
LIRRDERKSKENAQEQLRTLGVEPASIPLTSKRRELILGWDRYSPDEKAQTIAEEWFQMDSRDLSVDSVGDGQEVIRRLRLIHAAGRALDTPLDVLAVIIGLSIMIVVMLIPIALVFVAYGEVGPIRAFATLGFLAALLTSLIKSPRRLFFTLGTFLAFLAAGIVWQSLTWLTVWMESLAQGRR